jgi:hypothetical protein
MCSARFACFEPSPVQLFVDLQVFITEQNFKKSLSLFNHLKIVHITRETKFRDVFELIYYSRYVVRVAPKNFCGILRQYTKIKIINCLNELNTNTNTYETCDINIISKNVRTGALPGPFTGSIQKKASNRDIIQRKK